MAEREIILVPTLCVFASVAESDGFPRWMRERAKRLGESARKTVEAARRAGVAMAMGADAGPHGENARELVLMAEAGLSPLDALRAATSVPARVFGLTDRGRVAPGLRADLVLVDGDPQLDITQTRAVSGVSRKANKGMAKASGTRQISEMRGCNSIA